MKCHQRICIERFVLCGIPFHMSALFVSVRFPFTFWSDNLCPLESVILNIFLYKDCIKSTLRFFIEFALHWKSNLTKLKLYVFVFVCSMVYGKKNKKKRILTIVAKKPLINRKLIKKLIACVQLFQEQQFIYPWYLSPDKRWTRLLYLDARRTNIYTEQVLVVFESAIVYILGHNGNNASIWDSYLENIFSLSLFF